MVAVSAQTDQQKRIEHPEISPSCYFHLILDKGAKNMHGKKVSSTSSAEKTEYMHVKD
jgi:hypothetical protein